MKRDKIVFAVLFILIILSSYWILRSAIPMLQDRFVRWAQEKASETLNTEVRIESIRLTRWAGIEVRGLTIMDPLRKDEEFFSSPRIEVRLKPLRMIEGDIEFRLIALDDPRIDIAKVSDRWNLKSFGKPRSESEKKKSSRPFSMKIDRLVLRRSWTRISGLTRDPFETDMDFNGSLDVGDGKVIIGMGKSDLNTGFVSFGEFSFEGDLTIEGKRLSLDDFLLEKADTKVAGSGFMEFFGPAMCHFDVSSDYFDFAHIPPGVGTRKYLTGSVQIEAELNGRLLNPDVIATVQNCRGELLGYEFEGLSGEVNYSGGKVEVRDLASTFCGGILSGDFDFDFTESPASYSAAVTLDDFNLIGLPYPIPQGMSSAIDGELMFEGVGFNKQQFNASSIVSLTESKVGDMGFQTLDAVCTLSGEGLRIVDGKLRLKEGSIGVNGSILVDRYSLSVEARNVDIVQFPQILPAGNIRGLFTYSGTVGGNYRRTNLDGTFLLGYLGMGDVFKVQRIEGSCRIEDLSYEPEGEVQLRADGIEAGGIELDSFDGRIQLNENSAVMNDVFVKVDSTEFLEFSARVDREDEEYSFALSDITIHHQGSASTSSGTLVLHRKADSWLLDESTISFAGGRLMVGGELGSDGVIVLSAKADSIDLHEADRFLRIGKNLEGQFGAELLVSGTLDQPLMTLSMKGDRILYEGAQLDSVVFGASYASKIFFIDKFELWKNEYLARGSLNLPLDLALAERAERLDPGGNLYGEVTVNVPLNFVNMLIGNFRASGGEFNASLSLTGKAGSPRWAGQGTISSGSGLYIPTNSYFDVIDAAFHMEESSLVVDYLRAGSRKGGVDSSGRIDFEGFDPQDLDFAVHLKGFEINQVKHVAQLTLDGDLVVEGSVRSPLLRGNLQLSEGEFSLPFGRGPGDLEGREMLTFPINVDIIADSRDNVWFRNKQANVEMEIDLAVRGGPEGVKVSGEMRPVRGFYLFNGRRFQVDEGAISFVGSTIINPILDVNASRVIRGRVRDNLTGSLEATENVINLHVGGFFDEVEFDIEVLDETGSVLPVTREEAFTLLLLDMTKKEYDVRRGFYTERVQNQVATLLGQQAASLLQDASPLDVITIETDLFAQDAAGSAQVSVGKYFAKRFFLLYSQDIMEPSIYNISIEYGLRRRMFIVGQTRTGGDQFSDQFSLDFKYKFRF